MREHQWIRIPNRIIPAFSSTEDGDVLHILVYTINIW
jgi:hypothetical protein